MDYTFQKEPTRNIDDNEFIHHHLQGAKHSGFIPSITYHINEKQAIGGTIGFGFSNPEGEWIGSNSILKFNSQSYQLGIFYRHQYPIFDRLNVFIYPNLRAKQFKQKTIEDETDGIRIWYQNDKITSVDLNLKAGLSYRISEHIAFRTFVSNDLLSYEIIDPFISTGYKRDDIVFLRKHLVYGVGMSYQFSRNNEN